MSLLSPRLLSAGMVTAGVLLGTISAPSPAPPPRHIDGYWILEGDFHVHAFPGDGSLAPWSLRDEAAHAGLDVFAVTNHNQVSTAQFAERHAKRSAGPIVLAGEEITNPDYHLIAVGITRQVNANQPAVTAIADVHAQGGVAIAAHPGPRSIGYTDAAIAQLDGTEAAHPSSDQRERDEYIEFYRRAQHLNSHVAAIGSSDFHAMPVPIGSCRTLLFVRDRTAAGILDAIRNGRTVAVDEEGHLHGDASLTALASRETWSRSREDATVWRRTSVALAWAGLLGVLLLRG